jgi:sugar lactone lactonase YvrE
VWRRTFILLSARRGAKLTEQRILAPELPESLDWVNTRSPVRLAGQRGRVVLLNFWTYSSVNCLKSLEELAYLEKRFQDKLTVISIHCPKFTNEGVRENLVHAINRHYIRHPVANDPEYTVWQQYGIKAWPSIVFISPDGSIVGMLRGTGRSKQLESLIEQHLESLAGTPAETADDIQVIPIEHPDTIIKYPGRVLARGGKLYISDTGNNRVIEASYSGRVNTIYGTGTAALFDGMYQEAAFKEPQGLALKDNSLFVADTGNHAIRLINLLKRDVITLAGNGQAGKFVSANFNKPKEVTLNFPWDVTPYERVIHIAMAGSQQIWELNLSENTIKPFAGTGREAIDDGAVGTATFAQPSGMTAGNYMEPRLYILDSDSSSLRFMRYRTNTISTLIGKGLFEFGNVDGKGDIARMQFPMDLSFDEKRQVLWIADTFNHKIRAYSLMQNTLSTIPVSIPLHEPGGLCLDENILWIANTNAHEIVKLDLETGDADVLQLEIAEEENVI